MSIEETPKVSVCLSPGHVLTKSKFASVVHSHLQKETLRDLKNLLLKIIPLTIQSPPRNSNHYPKPIKK